jgi:hypothetical protein
MITACRRFLVVPGGLKHPSSENCHRSLNVEGLICDGLNYATKNDLLKRSGY